MTMGRPKGNGIVELVDDKPDKGGGFFCMDLVLHLSDEIDRCGDSSWEFWHRRFEQAKAGQCAYRDICKRYARTMERKKKHPVQLDFF